MPRLAGPEPVSAREGMERLKTCCRQGDVRGCSVNCHCHDVHSLHDSWLVRDGPAGHHRPGIDGLGVGDGRFTTTSHEQQGAPGQWRFNCKGVVMDGGTWRVYVRTYPGLFRVQPLLRVTGVAYVHPSSIGKPWPHPAGISHAQLSIPIYQHCTAPHRSLNLPAAPQLQTSQCVRTHAPTSPYASGVPFDLSSTFDRSAFRPNVRTCAWSAHVVVVGAAANEQEQWHRSRRDDAEKVRSQCWPAWLATRVKNQPGKGQAGRGQRRPDRYKDDEISAAAGGAVVVV